MTEQEIFDKVAKHLLTQNERASNGKVCRYRLRKRDGTVLKCAVGCLIKDDEYGEWMEYKRVVGLLNHPLLTTRLSVLFKSNLDLIDKLQRIHDDSAGPNWPAALTKLGNERGLSAKVLNEVVK